MAGKRKSPAITTVGQEDQHPVDGHDLTSAQSIPPEFLHPSDVDEKSLLEFVEFLNGRHNILSEFLTGWRMLL